MISNLINSINPWVSIITGIFSICTFLYVTVGGRVIRKPVRLHSLGPEPVRFHVQLRNYNVQQITNVVSARYFAGGTVPPHVRQEIIALTAPIAMKELQKNKAQTKSSLFINLTNHPSEKWGEKQRSEALALGPIVDIPFPMVDSSCDEQQMAELVTEYEKKILKVSADKKPIVHVMGELNFTYSLVNRLRQRGIVCVASTTERVVEDCEGKKVSTFTFVKFRRYE